MTINSKIVLNGLKKDLPTVKIIEPFQPSVIECETKEDFSAIINTEPDKYKEMTTQKLNKLFRIPGYKITKIKGEICLRNIKPCEKLPDSRNVNNDDLNQLKQEIKAIKVAFNELSDQLESIKSLIFSNQE